MKKRLMITGLVCALLLSACAGAASTASPTVPASPAKVEPLSPAEPATPADVSPAEPAAPADVASVEPAAPAEVDTGTADVEAPEAIPYSIGVRATVTDILNDDGRVSLQVKPEDGEEIILHLSDATILLDNQSAIPVGVEDIKVGDTIYAYHDIMMTMSIPGQTPALAVLTNLGEGAIAQLHMPEQVQRKDDAVSVLCDNGSIWVSTTEETVFTPYATRQIVTAADIQMGQPFLAWYEIVLESAPAQAVAERVMILPADYDTKELQLVIDGDMVVEAKMQDGVVIVPVRTAAETLGLKVGYQKTGDTAVVTVSDQTSVLSMTVGEDAYSTSGAGTAETAAPLSFGCAPFFADDLSGRSVTWMSAEAFQLLGYQVSLNHTTLHIQK